MDVQHVCRELLNAWAKDVHAETFNDLANESTAAMHYGDQSIETRRFLAQLDADCTFTGRLMKDCQRWEAIRDWKHYAADMQTIALYITTTEFNQRHDIITHWQ